MLLVPVERIELPTFGLQNRCSTAELNRQTMDEIVRSHPGRSCRFCRPKCGRREARRQIPDLLAKGYSDEKPLQASDNGAGCYHRAMESRRSQRRAAAKLPITACSVLSWLLGAAPALVRAADPAFCKPYARAALVQAREGLASPRCGASLQGTRWSTEFSVHYEWCLEASGAVIAAERDARAKVLKGCTDR